jgi:hypothetical protein
LLALFDRFDSLARGRELACLGSFGNHGSHGVQVDIRQARQHSGLIEKRLTPEASFPKMARHLVVVIGLASNYLGQTFHYPRDAREPLSQFFDAARVVNEHLDF